MEHIKSQLKGLKAITPDREFAARAKLQILGKQRSSMLALPRVVSMPHISPWGWLGAGLTTALLAVITIIPLAFPRPTLSASLNVENLANEYGNLPINIQLKEISYEQRMNQTITSALSEVSGTKVKHLNMDILKTEQQSTLLESSTTDVDAMLQQIMN